MSRADEIQEELFTLVHEKLIYHSVRASLREVAERLAQAETERVEHGFKQHEIGRDYERNHWLMTLNVALDHKDSALCWSEVLIVIKKLRADRDRLAAENEKLRPMVYRPTFPTERHQDPHFRPTPEKITERERPLGYEVTAVRVSDAVYHVAPKELFDRLERIERALVQSSKNPCPVCSHEEGGFGRHNQACVIGSLANLLAARDGGGK